jgi:hypothetical protein
VITVGLVNLIFSLEDESHDAPQDHDKDTARHLAALTETQVLDDEDVAAVAKKPARARSR